MTPELPLQVALWQYELLRRQAREAFPGPDGRATAIERALFRLFEEYTAPIRVVRFSESWDEARPHYVIFLVHGHGMEQNVWFFRGDHRERDAVRMAVVLRNLLAWGQDGGAGGG